MLSLALLLSAASFTPSKVALAPAQVLRAAACPSVPGLPLMANPQTCPALEVSGRADAAGVILDPAFQVVVASTQFSRSGRADAVLSGYGADGRTVFTFAFEANGPFHLYVPLAPGAVQSVTRLHLATPAGSTEQIPVPHSEPNAEVIALDDSHVLFAWDANAFPAIRIATATGAPPVAVGAGKSTYQQLTFASSARRFVVDFSDGIHSATRTFHVFGRS